jgi:hypothetical protein
LKTEVGDTGLRVYQALGMDELTGSAPESSDVIRFTLPDGAWPERRDPHIVIRPASIHWAAPAGDGAVSLLARQSRRQRERSTAASAALSALESDPGGAHAPVDARRLAEWTELYRAQRRRLRNGRDLAGLLRAEILEPDTGHRLLTWRADGTVVAGCIVRRDPAHDALVVRFLAVAASHRHAELPRAIYAGAADLAAAASCRWITAGTDPGITGGLVAPGLVAYKLRLGFTPVPADLFGVPTPTFAERVATATGIDQPILRFEYLQARRTTSAVADFLGGPDTLGLVSVTTPGFESEVLRSLPAHRRLVVEG